jgi:hypothetical protein
MLLPAILTIEAPQAHRAVGAIPAIYLLMGEGVQYVLAIATEGAKRARVILVAPLTGPRTSGPSSPAPTRSR